MVTHIAGQLLNLQVQALQIQHAAGKRQVNFLHRCKVGAAQGLADLQAALHIAIQSPVIKGITERFPQRGFAQ